jgi:galactose mutarotase-like enzyme
MEIELWNGGSKAIVDPQGAWLTNLSDEYGDILYPKRTLTAEDGSKKLRGGCHVCLPNFGPGGESDQPQHGFGRVSSWEVTDKTESSVLLTLARGDGVYQDLSALLTYQLEANAIVMTLELVNDGDGELRVAPGFHPYFSTLHDKEGVRINGENRRLDELSEVEFSTGARRLLETSQRDFVIESRNLNTWALWTDTLAPYVCVEPTFRGFAFLEKIPSKDELLSPGETRMFTATITWQMK